MPDELGCMPRDYPQIQRVLIITLLLNVIATGAKLGVGLWAGVLSLVADGLDNLFDGVSNIIGLIAVRMSSRPPDADHPYGHRKFETIAALFIAGALFLTAWELAGSAVARLFDPPPLTINWWTLGALLFGSTVQMFTGLWELRKARRTQQRSPARRRPPHPRQHRRQRSRTLGIGIGLVGL